jgi:hypothetical protein
VVIAGCHLLHLLAELTGGWQLAVEEFVDQVAGGDAAEGGQQPQPELDAGGELRDQAAGIGIPAVGWWCVRY